MMDDEKALQITINDGRKEGTKKRSSFPSSRFFLGENAKNEN
jgi:hypothetical protein